MVNWEDEDIQIFKKEAQATQQEYCDLLGDREWDVIDKCDWTILCRKVGFGLYNAPQSEPKDENKNTGYSEDQLSVIEKICEQLVGRNKKKNSDSKDCNIHFACIFIVMKIHDKSYNVPVFKAKGEEDESSECVFVDTGARKYSKWVDYLKTNTLQKCIYCYPTNGLYETDEEDEVSVKFDTSPACDLTNKVLRICDIATTAVTVAATGVGVAALCTVPIAGPVMAATAVAGVSTGAYGVSRSSYALIDRAKHGQSIGLTEAEARGCWLSIVGSSLGFAQGRMIASMTNAARAGEVMGKAGRIAFLAVQTGNLTVNGIGVIHGLVVLVDKHKQKELTPLDVFQFSASLLFFTNAAMNIKTAGTIIKEVQNDVIESHRQELKPRAKKVFNRLTNELRGPEDDIHGNAKVVKQLQRIENSKDLFETISNRNVDSRKVKLTTEGFKGLLRVNKNLKVHPLKLLEIPSEQRSAIFKSTKSFAKGTLTKAQFDDQMKPICREYRIQFESTRNETKEVLTKMFGKKNFNDIDVGGKKIFADATPHHIDRLRVVMENTAQNNELIMDRATEFAKRRGCTDAGAYIKCVELFVYALNQTVGSLEAKYQKDLADAKQRPDFNQKKFDEARGIPEATTRMTFHKQKALDQYLKPDGYDKLIERFNGRKPEDAPLQNKCKLGFFGSDSASYHYLKHKYFASLGVLTKEQYFKLAEEVVGNPTNEANSMLSQDGSCTIITYLEPKRGVRAIRIDRDGQSGIATVMYDKKLHEAYLTANAHESTGEVSHQHCQTDNGSFLSRTSDYFRNLWQTRHTADT